jgi:PAS domain-containing protein
MFATFGRDPSCGAPSLATFAEAIHRDDLELFDLSFAQAAVDGFVHRVEFRFLHPDGGTRWIESVTEPVTEEGRLVRMVGTMQDITERKQAGQQIRDQAELLDHAQGRHPRTRP